MNSNSLNSYMCQFGVWPNCCNSCDFCLRQARIPITKEKQLYVLDFIKKNIEYIDWKGKFSAGISLLGGELYYTTDKDIQESFLELIDVIIEKILKVSPNPYCRYSTVTNGIYEPTFLYKVVDRISDAVGINHVDINFSYDLKYRFKNEEDRMTVLKNINDFHKKYDYKVGVQMIMTQYLIDLWKFGEFDVNDFTDRYIPGNNLCFLYPHKIHTGKNLEDFNFKRGDFLRFISYLRDAAPEMYLNFILSTKNSSLFKWTGYRNRDSDDITQQPVLCDDKEIINERCGHSILYQCYSDTDKCMLCDLKNINPDII